GLEGASAGKLWLINFRQAVYLSQLLEAQGHTEQARQLRAAVAAWIDTNETRYGAIFARRVRAALSLLEGQRDAALSQLAESFRLNDYTHWWYTIEYDPLWLPLHDDPRFRAIATAIHRYIDAQRGELETLRRRGDVPRRAGSTRVR